MRVASPRSSREQGKSAEARHQNERRHVNPDSEECQEPTLPMALSSTVFPENVTDPAARSLDIEGPTPTAEVAGL